MPFSSTSNYEFYSDLSAKMMEVIGRFAPEQYIYSIDESFLSFNRCFPIPIDALLLVTGLMYNSNNSYFLINQLGGVQPWAIIDKLTSQSMDLALAELVLRFFRNAVMRCCRLE